MSSSSSRTRTKGPRSTRSRRNNVADLDDDVLIRILSYLPVKTLISSKTVSKRWLSIITNPLFTNRYIESNHPLPTSGFFLNRIKNNYNLISLNQTDQPIPLPLPIRFADHSTEMIIIQSTNGLLLCKCACTHSQFNTNYYVYNPTTKQNTLLPNIDGNNIALSLAFDPSESPHYKVFCLNGNNIYNSDTNLYHIEVYSSKEGPWRRLVSVPSFALPPTSPTVITRCHTVFWNGSVHWFDYVSRDCLSFDINQEKTKLLRLPYLEYQELEEYPRDIGSIRLLEESRGNLYFIEVNDFSSSNFPVYVMESGGSGWFLKHNVDLEPLAAGFPEMSRIEEYTGRRIYVFSIVGFVKGETDAESCILLYIPDKVVKYNFLANSFEKLCGFEALLDDGSPENGFEGFRTAFKFIESLANV